jgi:uncharacterized membrane protein YjjP (DUF1212 family)
MSRPSCQDPRRVRVPASRRQDRRGVVRPAAGHTPLGPGVTASTAPHRRGLVTLPIVPAGRYDPAVSTPSTRATPSATDVARAVQLALRAGVLMLSSGAQTSDVERSMRRLMRGLGLPNAEAVVTNSVVTVSTMSPVDAQPTTAVRAVTRLDTDYSRLAALSGVVSETAAGRLGIEDASAAIDRIESGHAPYPPAVLVMAAGLSAAGLTITFGGSFADGAATLAIGLLVQPVVAAAGRTNLPPLFHTVIGVTTSAFLVALIVGLGAPLNGSLVLTGALLRFLPGAALVAGMRDMVDRSIVTGTARLAEALLLGGAVAGSLGLVLGPAMERGVRLSITLEGGRAWPVPVLVAASMVGVGFYAIGLGVPRRALLSCAGLGAAAVLIGTGIVPGGGERPILVASLVVGAVGRMLARWQEGPASLWTVPAVLPLLPGLTIVQAMLAPTAAQQVTLLGEALLVAFTIGVGVASGDILVSTYQQVRERVARPVTEAVFGGTGSLVARPVREASPGDHPGTGADDHLA